MGINLKPIGSTIVLAFLKEGHVINPFTHIAQNDDQRTEREDSA